MNFINYKTFTKRIIRVREKTNKKKDWQNNKKKKLL